MILFERHEKDCSCSYCRKGDAGYVHYGLNIPKDWSAWNSWYVVKAWRGVYIRWTNRWFLYLKGLAN